MALDIGDNPTPVQIDVSNTSIMGLKDGITAVRIPIDFFTVWDLDGGDASRTTLASIELDGGSA